MVKEVRQNLREPTIDAVAIELFWKWFDDESKRRTADIQKLYNLHRFVKNYPKMAKDLDQLLEVGYPCINSLLKGSVE